MQNIETLLVIAETGSFHKAARRMGLGQSAVSRRVQKFEDTLGVSLFERRPNGARLTQAGLEFASSSRSILRDLELAIETVQAAGRADGGQLRIGIIASMSRGPLRNLISAFVREHQDVEICICESNRSELLTELSHRRLDAVVAAGTPDPAVGDGLLLAREPVYLAIPADHKWAQCTRIAWEDVRDLTFIVSADEPGPEIHDYILRQVSDLGQTVKVRRHRLAREGIMTLVGLGFGASLVADHWLGVSYPNVAFIPIGDVGQSVPFSITWRPENDNPALRRFMSLARIEAKRNGVLS
ncbi:MAG: LysR family transcriptional regulator [Pseudomonadota bacterium]